MTEEVLYVTAECQGAISTMRGTILRVNDRVKEGDLKPEALAHYRKIGYIGTADEAVALADRSAEAAAGLTDDDPNAAAPPTDPQRGKHRFTPEELRGLSLDELNIKVHEIDPQLEAFETVEEATAWLGQDL